MGEFDHLGTTPRPENDPLSPVKMRDVAVAAGVSVATVSNVINHPHLVAAHTRERVESVVSELGFRPNPHAKALRGLVPTMARSKQGTVSQDGLSSQEKTSNMPVHTAPITDTNPNILMPGQHLSLQVGKEFLSGIVDAVMTDKSYFWIWVEHGKGRRMINSSESVIVESGIRE